jgi:hypothetical protein
MLRQAVGDDDEGGQPGPGSDPALELEQGDPARALRIGRHGTWKFSAPSTRPMRRPISSPPRWTATPSDSANALVMVRLESARDRKIGEDLRRPEEEAHDAPSWLPAPGPVLARAGTARRRRSILQ